MHNKLNLAYQTQMLSKEALQYSKETVSCNKESAILQRMPSNSVWVSLTQMLNKELSQVFPMNTIMLNKAALVNPLKMLNKLME
jgi:hypothetical protein